MSVYTYTPGGTKLGDRIMAMKPFMLEKGGQKYWNELNTFINKAFGANVTMTGGRTTFGEIDLAVVGDMLATAIPRTFADPMVGRQMPGYTFPTTQIFIFQGFNG
jgi:hypothetical protein